MILCLYVVPFLRYSASKNGVTLKLGYRSLSRSLKMAPFDRPYTTFYWSAIVNTALSGTVFELVDVEWYYDLEIWVKGHSRSFKLKLGCGFIVAFHSNYGSVLHHLRDKARYWSKIVIVSYPLAFDAPIRGVRIGILPSRLVREN